ncbi:RND family efflux transporter MFP subunit [Onishia taeanensis]|uniref:RND family efflux transporter MFP subunit n=1 Tax=Onishia taeanensis TaxID=284577 RepID=A0A328Y1W9_9GAMM|nr:efflux RND transporter periplasmic adaptor subunit [Halomonas taeanensis]RAR63068.1 RND family efflux transporter MFP subunit [Halomonas taeanensis]
MSAPPASPSHPPRRPWLARLSAIAILALAVAVAGYWLTHRPQAPKRAPAERPVPRVEVMTVEHQAEAPVLNAHGRVLAARETTLSTSINGRLEAFAPQVEPGRRVAKGQWLARLERTDYELALREAEASLASAESDLASEQGEQIRAAAEYRTFGRDLPPARRALVLREPQLKAAKAAVETARAQRDRAQADLARTEVTAPFDAVIQEKLVGEGAGLGAYADILSLVGIERFWVRLNLPQEALTWLDTHTADGHGSRVELDSPAWPDGQIREGEVWSVLPSLEESGLMTQVMVAVDDPLALEHEGAPALRLGDLLEARLYPAQTRQLIRIPVSALRGNRRVWLLDENNHLRMRDVELAHRGDEVALIESGLNDGERVILGNLANAEAGMALKARDSEMAESTDSPSGDAAATPHQEGNA